MPDKVSTEDWRRPEVFVRLLNVRDFQFAVDGSVGGSQKGVDLGSCGQQNRMNFRGGILSLDVCQLFFERDYRGNRVYPYREDTHTIDEFLSSQ